MIEHDREEMLTTGSWNIEVEEGVPVRCSSLPRCRKLRQERLLDLPSILTETRSGRAARGEIVDDRLARLVQFICSMTPANASFHGCSACACPKPAPILESSRRAGTWGAHLHHLGSPCELLQVHLLFFESNIYSASCLSRFLETVFRSQLLGYCL